MATNILYTEFILYVSDQQKSTVFYSLLLDKKPDLNVPGMTEFILSDFCKLGLMPSDGIARILTPLTSHPEEAAGIPRCELYLKVDDLQNVFQRALSAGARLISEPADRDWGDCVGYLADRDGHIIALASAIIP